MGKGLPDVFNFWLAQIGKLIIVLKQIPIFKDISLFHVIIGIATIGIFIKIIKFGLNFKSIHSVKAYDNRTYTEERRY